MKEEDKDTYELFAKNVTKQRLKKGYSKKELSIRSGLNYQFVIRIEQAKARRIKMTTIYYLARALDVKCSEFFK